MLYRNIKGIGIALCWLAFLLSLSGCGLLKDDPVHLGVKAVIAEIDTENQTIRVKDGAAEGDLGESWLIDCSSISMSYCDFATQKAMSISFEDLQVDDEVLLGIRSSELESLRYKSGAEGKIKVEQLQLYTQRISMDT